jgi:hypothetical protein
MPDDKTKTGGPDRKRVAQHEPYEVTFFAAKHGIATRAARELIDRFGPSRERCDEAAERRKKK